mmetsp:Transcript_40317/g.96711  ORF Transcript_40317/g.96711 Transcript_40317/m.96711 type:complete len:678 (+) Transcript_40317:135-2168(+)
MRITGIAFLATAQASSPVDRVVTLLKELRSKIEADGNNEQRNYDDYACWCENTNAAKAKDIADANSHLEQLQNEIESRKGQLGSLEAELPQLRKNLAESKKSKASAQSMRAKQTEAYTETKGELEQGIAALHRATNALSGAGMNLESASLLSAAADLQGALRMAPKGVVPKKDLDQVEKFLSKPGSFSQQGAEMKPAYEPASGQIQGILKDMFESFAAKLEKANHEESEQRRNTEALVAAKTKEIEQLEDAVERKEAEEADATQALADAQQDKLDTEESLAADEKFFADTTTNCKKKGVEWATRNRLRTEELAGINQAVEILDSDDAKSTFGHATSTFVQLESWQAMDEMPTAARKAYQTLTKTVGPHHAQLAMMAAKIRMGGHFDGVIAQIDNTIQLLRREQKDDDKTKKACETQITATTQKKEDHQSEIDHLNTEKTRLVTERTEVNGDKNTTDTAITDHKDMMKTALDNRNTEHDRLEQSLKDDREAVRLLGSAIESLEEYYKKNEGQLQVRAEPEPAPDATFGGSKKSETSGIVGILENIKADLEKEIEEAMRSEDESGEAYQEELAENKETLKTLRRKRADLLATSAALGRKIASKKNDISAEEQDKEAAETLLGDLEENCEWVETKYEDRKEARKTEMDELVQAKATLQGYDEADSEDALLQEHKFLRKHA